MSSLLINLKSFFTLKSASEELIEKANFAAAAQGLQKSQEKTQEVKSSLLCSNTKGYADFLPSESWQWFTSAD